MTTGFHVQVLNFSNLVEIDGAWTKGDFTALLEQMEFGDQSGLSEADRRDMCLMSLHDLDPDDAAYLVLKHVIGDALREGQLRNMAHEMLEEKLWEDYVDPACHERLFNVGSLLHAAVPRVFLKPDAARVRLVVTCLTPASRELLSTEPNESFLVRLLADGMDDQSVLYRMYGDQLRGKSFPDADKIVWIVRAEAASSDVWSVEVISSGYWLDALQGTKSYDSNAYADVPRA